MIALVDGIAALLSQGEHTPVAMIHLARLLRKDGQRERAFERRRQALAPDNTSSVTRAPHPAGWCHFIGWGARLIPSPVREFVSSDRMTGAGSTSGLIRGWRTCRGPTPGPNRERRCIII